MQGLRPQLLVRLRGALDPVNIGFVVLLGLAVAVRIALFDHKTFDTEEYEQWLNILRRHGGFQGLKYETSSHYTPFYSYLLLLGSSVQHGFSDLVVIKWGSFVADFVCAYFVFKIVRLRYADRRIPLIAAAAVLLAPTVVVNSAYWGQTDMLWAAPLVASTYYLLEKRGLAAVIAFALSVAIKPQGVFFLPILLLLAARRELRWRYFLAVPIVYVITFAPAYIAGRPLFRSVTYYGRVGELTGKMSYRSPNAFRWFPANDQPRASWMWGTAVILLVLLVAAAVAFRMSATLLIALATASVLLVPFVLPKMHERYFFAADVLSIVLVFYAPRLFPIALLIQLTSLLAYNPYLFGEDVVPMGILALFELIAIVLLFSWIALEIRARKPETEPIGAAKAS
jgi:Gpi18-like mannosyltransferase